MTPSVSIEELRKVIALSDMPEALLQWILEHTDYLEYDDGTLIMKKGDPTDVMWIILEGRFSFYMDVNGQQVYYYNFENDATTGGIGGLLPHSRMKISPGYAYALGKVRGLMMNKKYFPELEQLSPDLIHRLIGYMTERARFFATVQLQHEKVSALGKLSAGIAHELNNPAAAINRISSELFKKLKLNFELTEKLLRCNISPIHIHNINSIIQLKEKEQAKKTRLSALQRMDIEDEIIAWLEKNGMTENREAGETFSEFGFSGEDFENMKNNVSNDAFICILQWLENLISSQRIIKDLEEASSRISNLVGAIKSHVHMDRTNDLQPTNIHNDIENTLTLLGYKMREKNININKTFCSSLPDIPVYVGELNQVWTNIIDNAIYAMGQNGELTIKTVCDSKNLNVFITDNGSGIPKEIISRIFDPFYTTKKVGEGTGIGLDLVSRIIKRHNGEIKVDSEPGRTTFEIRIPLVPGNTNQNLK